MDETDLYYKLPPSLTYALQLEGKIYVGGSKAMSVRDSFTTFIYINADESK